MNTEATILTSKDVQIHIVSDECVLTRFDESIFIINSSFTVIVQNVFRGEELFQKLRVLMAAGIKHIDLDRLLTTTENEFIPLKYESLNIHPNNPRDELYF